MRLGAIGSRALVLIGATALALGGLLATPAAAQTQPPGWIDQGPDKWVGFKLDTTAPSPSGRTTYDPVTLVRTTNLPTDELRAAFGNWDTTLDSGGNPIEWRWPVVWEAGGVRLERVAACDYTAGSCQYSVVAADAGQSFWFFGGTPPVDSGGNPDPNPASYNQGTIDLAPLPTIHLGTLGATGIAGTGGAAGKIHLDAPGTADELAGTTLTYKWTLIDQGPGGKTYTAEGSDDFFEPTVEADGDYCVDLTVTASDGFSQSTGSCAGGTGAIFNITGVAPAPSGGGGTGGGGTGGGGTAGGGGGTGGGGGGIPGIGFSNPARRAPAALTGGGVGLPPTVIWLWRPEWFQPVAQTNDLPRTDGQPEVRGRHVIVVRTPSPRGASAGPLLAGVGIFGLVAGGWVISRRRRLRMLAEL